MLSLFAAQNLSSTDVAESIPWQFSIGEERLGLLRGMKKANRRRWLADPSTRHDLYSCVRGLNSAQRVGPQNEVAGIRAFAADYDAPTSPEAVVAALLEVKEDVMPSYLEMTLGGKARLVWLFPFEVSCGDTRFAELFLKECVRMLKAEHLLAGYDAASVTPTQLWTNGCEWYQLTDSVLSEELVHTISIEALSRDFKDAALDVPMATIEAEVHRRFPNRWAGDFTVGSVGVRFWDPAADNPRGAFVAPWGLHCLTGGDRNVTWEDIFGGDWVREQRVLNLGLAARGVYFDGKTYWQRLGEHWQFRSREDTLLYLGTRGLARKAARGQMVSDAERVLNHIQEANRVEAAVPLIFQPDGLVVVAGSERVLNISTVRALPMAPKLRCDPEEDFPFVWSFLSGFFDRPELRPLDYFLTWLRRAYVGALTLRPVSGQAVFICGPKENGKTLLAMRIVAPMLGGKSANPYDYLMKQTQFNSEIFSAGLLAINDEDAPFGEKDKEAFLQRVKAFVANTRFMLHGKFRDRVEIEWTGRLLTTLNEDAKASAMLPEVNSNTADKLHFFATQNFQGDWPERYALEALLSKELPFFCRWLADTYMPPADIVAHGSRSGMRSFHDPILLDMSQQQEAAFELRELLCTWIDTGIYWRNEDNVRAIWEGTPTALLNDLNASELSPLMREWRVSRVARSLHALSRVDPDAVQVDAGAGRQFVLVKKALLRRRLKLEEMA